MVVDNEIRIRCIIGFGFASGKIVWSDWHLLLDATKYCVNVPGSKNSRS